MCGRYTLIRLAGFTELFPWITGPGHPTPSRYNVAPTQPVAVVANKPDPQVEFFHWGLIPSWAKDRAIGNRMINARSETAEEKPAFRTALRKRRCLIVADGFYEWRLEPDGKTKQPIHITLDGGKPFAFAGLWETWNHDGEPLRSCTILTTTPNAEMSRIHDRMPVILDEIGMRTWLQPHEIDPEELRPLLKPFEDGRLSTREVSRAVNNPRNEDESVLK